MMDVNLDYDYSLDEMIVALNKMANAININENILYLRLQKKSNFLQKIYNYFYFKKNKIKYSYGEI